MPSGKRDENRKPTTWRLPKRDAKILGHGLDDAPAIYFFAPAVTGALVRRSSPTVDDSGSVTWARITGALVRSRSVRVPAPGLRGDLVILFLSLGLGGARTGDGSLRLGRLLLDGRLVVFPATGQPQEAKAQQSKAQSTGEQPHDEYDSPQEWARRRSNCIPQPSRLRVGRLGRTGTVVGVRSGGAPRLHGRRIPPSRRSAGPLFMLLSPYGRR